MSKFSFALALLFGLGFQGSLASPDVAAQQGGANVANLRQRLEYGLKARLPSEFRFIGRVVAMVGDGDLPAVVVDSTFHWVRKRRAYERSLVPYFERALRLRAAKLGIRI